MSEWGYFLFESGICLAMFYSIYWLFLKNDVFFIRNRIILLTIIWISLIIPFLNVPIPFFMMDKNYSNISNILPHYYFDSTILRNPEMTNEINQTRIFNADIFNIAFVIYIFISTFLLMRFLFSIYQIYRLIQTNNVTAFKKYKLINLEADISAFSFFNVIFINRSRFSDEEFEKIISHEIQHARQYHSLDLLLVELVFIFQWFNPFVWALKKSLQETHEFLADASVIEQDFDAIKYQILLLNQLANKKHFVLINNFKYSIIKRRVEMMIKIKTKRYNHLKVLFLFPVLLFLLSIFANNSESSTLINVNLNDRIIFEKPLKTGHVTSPYGVRLHPVNKQKILHRGIDIGAPKGTEVFAAYHGIVVWTKKDEAAGKNILIQHENEFYTFYSQLDEILVDEGQKVKTGDIIGSVGESSIATAPHLHFEIRKKDQFKNPEDFIDFSKFKIKK